MSVFLERRHKTGDAMDLGACFQSLLKFLYSFDYQRTVLRYPRYETDFSKVFRWYDITRLARNLVREEAPLPGHRSAVFWRFLPANS